MPASAVAPDAPPAGPRWTRWFTIVVTVVALGAMIATVWSVGPRTLYDQLRAIGWWFAVILALEGIATLCDALVLHGFLGPGGRRPGFLRVLEAQVCGHAINIVTPSLGEATKVTILMRHTDAARAVATVVRFNLAGMAVNLAFILVGAPICAATLPLPTWMSRTLWVGTAIAALIALVMVIVVRAGLVVSLSRVARTVRLISRARFEAWRVRLEALDAATRGQGGLRSWAPALWTLPSKVLVAVGAWLVLYANGDPPGVGVMAALASAGTVITVAANIVPLGLGVSEGGTAVLMAALGESPTLGITMVLARRVVSLTYAALGLIVFAAGEGVPAARHAPPAPQDRPAPPP